MDTEIEQIWEKAKKDPDHQAVNGFLRSQAANICDNCGADRKHACQCDVCGYSDCDAA